MLPIYDYSPDGARVLSCTVTADDGTVTVTRRDWDGDASVSLIETRRPDGATFWAWVDDTDLGAGPFLSEAQARAEAAEFFRAARPCNGCGRLARGALCDDCR